MVPKQKETCQKYSMRAATKGYVGWLDFIRVHGAGIGLEHLVEAMAQPGAVRPHFQAVQYLIDVGVAVTEILRRCEARASLLLKGRYERDKQGYITDGTTTVILVFKKATQ